MKSHRRLPLDASRGRSAVAAEPARRRHTRPLQRLRTDLPRSPIDQTLHYSLGAFITVCAIKRNGAGEHVRGLEEDKPAPRSVTPRPKWTLKSPSDWWHVTATVHALHTAQQPRRLSAASAPFTPPTATIRRGPTWAQTAVSASSRGESAASRKSQHRPNTGISSTWDPRDRPTSLGARHRF